MALVSCPECQQEVSSLALACAYCAYPYPGKQGFSEEKLQACSECGGVISKKAQACPHCGITCTDSLREAKETTVDKETTDETGTIEETWLCSHCGTPYTRKVPKTPEIKYSVPTSKVQEQPILQEPPKVQEPPSDSLKPEPKPSPKPPAPDGRGLSFTSETKNSEPPSNVQEARRVPEQPILQEPPKVQEPSSPNLKPEPKPSPKPPAPDGRGLSFAAKFDPPTPHQTGRHPSPLWFPSATSQDPASSPSPPKKKRAIMVGIVLVFLVILSMMLWVLWQPNGTNFFDSFTIPAWSMNHVFPSVYQSGT